MALKAFGTVNTANLLPQTVNLVQKQNGLSEGEAAYEVIGVHGPGLISALPALGSVHPFSNYVWMESRRLTWTPQGIRADCRYAGAELASLNVPQYELVITMDEQPIETHPDFDDIAGTPSSPQNGAIFIDADTGQIGTDDETAFFDRFAPILSGGSKNPKAGLEAFLSPSVTYRENYVTTALPSASGFGTRTSSVPGPGFPGTTGSRDWLYLGFTYQRRGAPGGGSSIVYEVTREWRLSGRGGWDDDIYD